VKDDIDVGPTDNADQVDGCVRVEQEKIDPQDVLNAQSQLLFSDDQEDGREVGHEDVQTPSVGMTAARTTFKALLVAFEYSGSRTLSFTCSDMMLVSTWLQNHFQATIGYVTDACEIPQGYGQVLRKSRATTKDSITQAFDWLLEGAMDGDTLFFYFSGHGLRVPQVKNLYSTENQCKGNNKAHTLPLGEALLLPKVASQDWKKMMPSIYTDSDFYDKVAKRIPQGVHLFAVVDACHSGTFMNLPWNWISQEYYRTCPGDAEKRQFFLTQFAWEWRSVTQISQMIESQLAGTVSLIASSQSYQTSRETSVNNPGHGVMTSNLFLHKVSAPAIMDLALENGWSWAKTISFLVRRIANENEGNVAKNANWQIPNFGTSHQFDMSEVLTLDGLAIKNGKASQVAIMNRATTDEDRKALEERLSCSKSDSGGTCGWKNMNKCRGKGNGKADQ